jgi:hypothetical protein
MPEQNPDPELKAIEQVMQALGSLNQDARERVVNYVFQRLGLAAPATPAQVQQETLAVPIVPTPPAPVAHGGVHDIRSFRASKNPKSDNEMAALVAYYLKHLAPAEERNDAISTADIEKYFVQANYPLPKQPRNTLTNAKNAGYFDSAERGFFKLNPVGHNLVAHGLGKEGQQAAPVRRRGKRKPASKGIKTKRS